METRLCPFQATQYTEMVNWQKDELFEPPILSGTADEVIQSCVEDCSKVMTLVGDFLCHTHAVERTVKLVTQAAKSVCGSEARDGYIKSTLRSRNIMPKFNTKKDFVAASSADVQPPFRGGFWAVSTLRKTDEELHLAWFHNFSAPPFIQNMKNWISDTLYCRRTLLFRRKATISKYKSHAHSHLLLFIEDVRVRKVRRHI